MPLVYIVKEVYFENFIYKVIMYLLRDRERKRHSRINDVIYQGEDTIETMSVDISDVLPVLDTEIELSVNFHLNFNRLKREKFFVSSLLMQLAYLEENNINMLLPWWFYF